MVLVEAAGESGHIRVRFAASQREMLEAELETWRTADIEGLKMVRKRDDTNPAFIAFKEEERDLVTAVLAELALIPEGEDFTLTGDSGVLFGCILGAAGIATEQLMNRTDALRAGAAHADGVEELEEQLVTAARWVRTLLAAQQFEPSRRRPQQLLPASGSPSELED